VEKREGRVVVPGDGVLLAGRYRLQDRIAAGGAGEVWRACDAVLGRAVAVKLLCPEYAGNGEMLARFRAEARYAALVCHPGWCRCMTTARSARSARRSW
jgi:serine/threonine protein kinase